MRELVDRSGFPKTMIQHYLREGLLPKPRKPHPNSALYDEAHLDRLRMIGQARALLGDRPPAGQLRRVVELIDQGVEVEVAVALQRAVWAGTSPGDGEQGPRSVGELASALSVPEASLRRLVDAGMLVPAPDAGDQLDEMDARLAGRMLEATERIGMDLGLMSEVAALLTRASALEMEVRNRVVDGLSPAEASEISRELQELVNIWHPYVLFRARQRDIARHGIGPAETGRTGSGGTS